MEKYLIILVLAFVAYYSLKCFNQTKEGFADAQTVDGIDESNSVNTLAKIAKDIMEGGGLKVAGGLSVSGTGNDKISGPNGTLRMNNQGIQLGGPNNGYETNSAQITAGLHDADSLCLVGMGKDGSKRKITMWNEGGLKINGPVLGDANFTPGGGIRIPAKNGASHRIIGGCGPGCAGENSIEFHAYKPDGNWEANPITIAGSNVTFNGNVIRTNPIYRKHDIAGYYQIRAYGWKVPIYYGFNMFWTDHNYKEALRNKYGWPEYMFNNRNMDMRQSNDGDQNWTARFLTVFPGYKVRMYSWDGFLNARDEPVRGAGEYPFGDNNKRIHGIYVALAEEGDPPADLKV